jgi:hypothetical protein
MSTEVTPKEIRHQNIRYKYADGGPLYGYVKDRSVEVPERFPWINWKGEPMPYELYQKILRFFEWSQAEHKSEALVYLYYNDKEREWMAWAPPQESRGMTVKSKEDHPNFKQANEFKGFIKIGTAHHHCTMSAFQSGTDRDDECTGNGLHYTIGKLDERAVDYHFRAVFNGNMQNVDPYYWIGLPPNMEKAIELAPELTTEAYKQALTAHAPKDMEVPEIWKENFFPSTYSTQGSRFPGSDYHPGSTWNPITKTWERWNSGASENGGGNGSGAEGGVAAGGATNGTASVGAGATAGANTGDAKANGDTPAKQQPVVSLPNKSQGVATAERHGGLSNEDAADLELSEIVRGHDLGTTQLYRIATALEGENFRTNIVGEFEIEKLLAQYGLGIPWLRNWISDNDQWASWSGQG